VLIVIAAAVMTVIAWSDLKPADAYPSAVLPIAALVYAILGAMVIRRVRNRIGWLLLAEGLGMSLLAFTSIYAVVTRVRCPQPR
jgi:hypothetical protein